MNSEDGNGDARSDSQTNRWAALVEKVAIAISILLVALLLGYAIWQLSAVPGAMPQVQVIGTQPLSEEHVLVTVELRNRQNMGLEEVLVSVPCRRPPVRIVFTDVPAYGTTTARVICPAETTNPEASIIYWIE